MRPGVLLPDPVWNLALVCWMDLQTIINHLSDEMSVEEREGQLTGTRPKTMNRLVSPGSSGELCPLEDLNPAHDDRGLWITCQVANIKYFLSPTPPGYKTNTKSLYIIIGLAQTSQDAAPVHRCYP